MTTGGSSDQPGYGAPGPQYGTEGQPVPPQPSYPTPPPAYGAQPGYPGAATHYGAFPPAPPAPNTPGNQASGFFQALFDFNFNSYVTPKVVKVLYILLTVLLALYVLGLTVAGFSSDSPGLGLVFLVLGLLGFIVFLALIRISLEFYVAVIKIAEDVKELKSRP